MKRGRLNGKEVAAKHNKRWGENPKISSPAYRCPLKSEACITDKHEPGLLLNRGDLI